MFGLAAVLLMSPKFQLQAVPAPPEASAKVTVSGGSNALGEIGSVSMAGAGRRQVGPPEAIPVIPVFTGNTADDETATEPPTMPEMTGVMTWNLQVNATAASRPCDPDRDEIFPEAIQRDSCALLTGPGFLWRIPHRSEGTPPRFLGACVVRAPGQR